MKTQGTVKWFSDQKGYGFIDLGEGEKDLFVHRSNIQPCPTCNGRRLNEGEVVEFEVVEDDRGQRAVNVVVLVEDETA